MRRNRPKIWRGARRTVALAAALAAASAILSMALAAGASASLIGLCASTETPCAAYPAGTTVKAVSTNLKIETETATYTCGEATATFTTASDIGAPALELKPGSFKLSSCKVGASACAVETTKFGPASLSEEWAEPPNGILDFGELAWEWDECAGAVKGFYVTFEVSGAEVALEGGSPGSIEFNKLPVYCGGWCSSATMSADFSVESPDPLYVEEKVYSGSEHELADLPVIEPFDGSAASLERFGSQWGTLGWAVGSTPKGQDTATGWGPKDTFATGLNGAYYNTAVKDAGYGGIATVATMAVRPNFEGRYFSLWLDVGTPGGTTKYTKTGYELRFTSTANSSDTYDVKLVKWALSYEEVLASKTGYTFKAGNSLAIVDEGAGLSAFTDTGSGFTQLLSVEDTALHPVSPHAVLSGAGNVTRLTNFRAGAL